MTDPHRVQYLDLTAEHFARHPVWENVHGADVPAPWHDDADEETFRPWPGALPVGSEDGFFLVRASFTLADGTILPGFVSPQTETPPTTLARIARSVRRLVSSRDDAWPSRVDEVLQGEVFLPGGGRAQFWDGAVPLPVERRAALLAAFGRPASAVLPVRVEAGPGLARGRAGAVFRDF